MNAENTPDNIRKDSKQGYRRVPKIKDVSSEGKKKNRISKTIKKKRCGDPGNYEAVFH